MTDQFTSVQWDNDAPWDTDFHEEHIISTATQSQSQPPQHEIEQEESQLLAPDLTNELDNNNNSNNTGINSFPPRTSLNAIVNNNNYNHHLEFETGIDNDDEEEEEENEHQHEQYNKFLANPTLEMTASKPTFDLKVHVQNPKTHHEGSNVYTLYELLIETNHPKLENNAIISRRYSDFDFLYQCLSLDFPTILVPPLPNKKRLEYIKGGRFTQEFISKRLHSLNLFIQRIINHPILSKSEILIIFLNNDEYWKTYKSNLNLNINGNGSNTSANGNGNGNLMTNNIEGFTEFIMNSFKKPHIESKYSSNFKDISNQSQKLEENLNKIDKIYTKVVNKQSQISNDLTVFGEEFSKLTILFKNDFNGKHRPDEEIDNNTKLIINKFKSFSSNLKSTGDHFRNLNNYIEYQYLNDLKELEHYIFSLNQLIKLKDNKIIDYEVLNSYLEKSQMEKSDLENGGSITNSTEGAISYWSKKLEMLTGLGLGNSGGTTGSNNSGSSNDLVNERINKLTQRIELLKSESDKSKKIYERFEQDILNEWKQFQIEKDLEIQSSLSNLTNQYQNFYQLCQDDWIDFTNDNDDNNNNENDNDNDNENDNDSLHLQFENKLNGENNHNIYHDNNDVVETTQNEINNGLQKLGIQ